MDDSPQDVYAKCLPNNRGYPLWFPEPSSTLPSSYKQDGLQIGDVGYVGRKGIFNVLFNICYGPNHALHRRLGVSFSFDPVAFDLDHEVDIISNADPPGCIIISPGITQPSQTSQRPSHYEFTPSSAKGAILILPDGATSHDLPANERFRKVAMEHAFEWYEFAKEHYGENINNGSLYLITGFYKARSWSLASFHDAIATENRHIRVMPRESKGIIAGRDWKCTFPVQYRDGPGLGHNGNVNQTIFISGFKIAVRDDVLGWLSQKPEVLPVPAVRSRKGPCGFARLLMRLFGRTNTSKRRRKENGATVVDHVPALSQPFHPSDIINRYLLNKDPDALVAVTHDSEWIALIETGKLTPEELTQEDRLEEFLSENYSLVSQPENSAVSLQAKSTDQEVSSKSEGFWYARPLTDNLQVVITRIRAEDVVAGFKRMPVGFYVLVQFGGTKRRTENKSVRLHDSVIEWGASIQLPPDPSAKVQLCICASFEFSPMVGTGEILRTVEICVGDVISNTHFITFSPTEDDVVLPCSSLLITTERWRFHKSGTTEDEDEDEDLDREVSSDLAQLTDQGHEALLRFRDDPRKVNIGVSVAYFEHAIAICSRGHHQCYAATLCNLARVHFVHCQIDRGPAELSRSISCYREALQLRRNGHPDRPATLLYLVEVLLYDYGKFGFERSHGEIMELVSEVQTSCPIDSHERRAANLALQTYVLYKAISSGSLADIDELIPALRQAVEDIPYNYDKLQRLSNLGLALRFRFELYGQPNDLDESIAIHEEAMQFTPCGHPYEPVILTNLSVLILGRFGLSRDPEDLTKSISLAEDAVRCTPDHHPDYPSRLAILSNALLARFQLLGEIGDLLRSTTMLEDALAKSHQSEHPVVLIVLAVARFTRFCELGDLDDLYSAITLMDEALGFIPNSHFARPWMLALISSFYFTCFEVSGNFVDLDHSIIHIREAIRLTQHGHSHRPMMVAALRRRLFLHLRRVGWLAEFDELISLQEETVQSTSDDDASKPFSLAHLGNSFFVRFQQTNDLPDLDKAISAFEGAVQLATIDRAEMLSSLGNLFRARFRKLGEVGDLDRSIEVTEDALALTPVGHAARSEVLRSLGISCVTRTQHRQRQRQEDDTRALE